MLLHQLTRYAEERLGHQLELGAIHVDPWRLVVVVDGGRLALGKDTLARFGAIAIELDASSLWLDKWQVRRISMHAPVFTIAQDAGGKLNWAPFFAALARNDGTPAPRLQLRYAIVEAGRIEYRGVPRDGAHQGQPALEAQGLHMELRDFSTPGTGRAAYSMRAGLSGDARITSSGTLTSTDASGEVKLDGLTAETFARLVELPVALTQGTLRASTQFSARVAGAVLLDHMEAELSKAAVTLPGGTASAEAVVLKSGAYDPSAGSIEIGRLQLRDVAATASSGEQVAGARLAQVAIESLALSIRDRSVNAARLAIAGLRGRDTLVDADPVPSRLAQVFVSPASKGDATRADAAAQWKVAVGSIEARDSEWRIQRTARTPAASGSMETSFALLTLTGTSASSGASGSIALARFEASGGALRVVEQARPGRGVVLQEIAMSGADVRLPGGAPFKAAVAFQLPPAGRVSVSGEVDPRTGSAALALKADKLALAAAQPWLPAGTGVRLASGELAIDGRLQVAPSPRGSAPQASFEGAIGVRDLKLDDARTGSALFAALEAQAGAAKLVLSPASIDIGELKVRAPSARIALAKDGTLVLGAPGTGKTGGAKERARAQDPQVPLAWRVRRLALSEGRLDFADATVEPAVALHFDQVAGSLTELGGKGSGRIALQARVNERGTAKVSGTLDVLDPLAGADLAVEVGALELGLANAYVKRFARVQIASGTVSAQGRLKLAKPGSGPAATFDGGIEVREARVNRAGSGDLVFAAQAVRAAHAKISVAPAAVEVGELVLEKPAGSLAIGEDGSLDFASLLVREAPAAGGGEAHSRFPLTVKKVTVADGRLDFSDRSIKPGFAVRIDELAGTLTGLDAAEGSVANVELEGRVDEYGSARIHGSLDPFDPGSRTDLTLTVRNLEMTALNPYAGRFAGYRIESGRLSGELRYRVKEGSLKGENHLVMEKLKLGEKVASPEAADLPLALAIALLTDSKGRVEMEIPVTGDLENQKFDLASVIASAIAGAIRKAVTAPFRLLASIFGSGEESIDEIFFDPGSTRITPPAREKIDALARALAARPQLGLNVVGAFDANADADALRKAKVVVDPAALLDLAAGRGVAVRAALVAQGTAAGRVVLGKPQSAQLQDGRGVPAALSLSAR